MTRSGHDGMPPQGQDFAEFVRHALHAAADQVEPRPDGLERIRARVGAGPAYASEHSEASPAKARAGFLAAGFLARGRPSILLQGRTKGGHATGRVAFDGAAADAHAGGDVGLGQVGVVAQHDRLALPFGQAAQGRDDGVPFEQDQRAVLGAGHVRRGFLHVLDRKSVV